MQSELKDEESFEKARKSVLDELENVKSGKIMEINSLKLEVAELYIKTSINLDRETNFEEENNKINMCIEKIRNEITTMDQYTRFAKEIKQYIN
ncbi:hypothetical protein psyc5s11_32680 [Clostridium gelidum]|uniref:Uncharacterized protein n=1 Tax=Clostridium gelidum TaxID=704125 RepID=A0ABM7TEA5_9CLOT|nr:hypothetical protein [Clostridium gelidum]BCZ47201.1 hypothetical protein psyc5s11_32680 [Clostridium gelidum]